MLCWIKSALGKGIKRWRNVLLQITVSSSRWSIPWKGHSHHYWMSWPFGHSPLPLLLSAAPTTPHSLVFYFKFLFLWASWVSTKGLYYPALGNGTATAIRITSTAHSWEFGPWWGSKFTHSDMWLLLKINTGITFLPLWAQSVSPHDKRWSLQTASTYHTQVPSCPQRWL